MKIDALEKKIKEEFSEIKTRIINDQYLQLKVSEKDLVPFLRRMKRDYGFIHLSAISCVDWIEDNQFELSYHIWSYQHKILIDADVRIDREKAEFDSVIDLYHPAKFFERDIYEFFGVTFRGNDDMNKFILTDWDGIPPLRKDFITRKYALENFSWREYQPDWAKNFGLSAKTLNNYMPESFKELCLKKDEEEENK